VFDFVQTESNSSIASSSSSSIADVCVENEAPSPPNTHTHLPANPNPIIATLQGSSEFKHLNVGDEWARCSAWYAENYKRPPTERGFVNWLKRAEAPLDTSSAALPAVIPRFSSRSTDKHAETMRILEMRMAEEYAKQQNIAC
jgi:hypothetical protein